MKMEGRWGRRDKRQGIREKYKKKGREKRRKERMQKK